MATSRAAKPADAKTEKVTDGKFATGGTLKTDTGKSYVDEAGKLAADVRELAEAMCDQLSEINDRVADLQQTDPGTDGSPAADHIRRIPMSTADVATALRGLVAVSAELMTRAQSAGSE